MISSFIWNFQQRHISFPLNLLQTFPSSPTRIVADQLNQLQDPYRLQIAVDSEKTLSYPGQIVLKPLPYSGLLDLCDNSVHVGRHWTTKAITTPLLKPIVPLTLLVYLYTHKIVLRSYLSHRSRVVNEYLYHLYITILLMRSSCIIRMRAVHPVQTKK